MANSNGAGQKQFWKINSENQTIKTPCDLFVCLKDMSSLNVFHTMAGQIDITKARNQIHTNLKPLRFRSLLAKWLCRACSSIIVLLTGTKKMFTYNSICTVIIKTTDITISKEIVAKILEFTAVWRHHYNWGYYCMMKLICNMSNDKIDIQ